MMSAIIMGVCGVLVIGIAIGAAIAYSAQSHEQRSYQEDREPDISRISTLGPCSYCNGDVDALSGYKMSCDHFLHYTCAATLRTQFGSVFDSKMVCKTCTYMRLDNPGASPNSGLRNRTQSNQECVNCRKPMKKDEPRRIACPRHRVHQTCWERMQETSTTCPGCMES